MGGDLHPIDEVGDAGRGPVDAEAVRRAEQAGGQLRVGAAAGAGGAGVRAAAAEPVLNIAHRAELKSSANPACWNASPVNVATNSRERPGVYRAVVRANAPSTVSRPPETVAAPPVFQGVPVQSAGRAVPENSAPAVGLRMTSPSPVCARATPASGVPPPKSAAVVSVKVRYGCVVNDQVMSEPTGVPSAPVTLPETVTW